MKGENMSKKEKNQNENGGLDKVIENTFAHLNNIVDANTVVGKVIDLGGVYIVPVSKISVGMISGGGTLPKSKNSSMSAGSGTGFNIVPMGFITVSNQTFRFFPVNPSNDVGSSVMDMLYKFCENLSNKNKGDDDEKK